MRMGFETPEQRHLLHIPTRAEEDASSKKKPKLIIFDDFINLTKKEFKKINPFLISGRKYGFTVWLMAQ